MTAQNSPSQVSYDMMLRQLTSFLEASDSPMAALANCAAILWNGLNDVNWAGFYLLKEDRLILGPFQGKAACIVIPMGRGVCGTAAEKRETVVVPDVHAFPGHIACDSASNSEIVIPLIAPSGRLLGVMDIDSPILARFEQEDAEELKKMAALLAEKPDWEHGLL